MHGVNFEPCPSSGAGVTVDARAQDWKRELARIASGGSIQGDRP
jgi:hypothetical protein